ncbi:arylsulfatase [Intrasporangium oryzae NRRL B-24470]|uniref:Arylsulfatase n=1 Tax=Intrasporangium oryzae NRRL B-24470 TaxID=1386089 RepID=W9GA52_9MICO|nr:arylsulfatase [Intrasporangium oryzae]EWT01713.1 arylsulfatase [Intrasporangium oryzae NRRL B-24470]
MALNEYEPGTSFPGVIGRTPDESVPAWPRPLRAREGSPNVLIVVLDDTGFGHLGCYGSPIRTPNLDRLAERGLRYNNMHTTALCSPSRSCILTGRNHHSNGMACVTEGATGYPGYNGMVPFENGLLSEMLLLHGYSTFLIGKYHLLPSHEETAAGPYTRWPLGRGFERFYGFLGGDTSQWHPDLVYDNHQVDPPRTPEEGYHLTEDLADRAIQFIADAKQIDPAKPFYLHFCPGATHAPHHVPADWADRYKGAFDEGWEVYRERVFARQKELGVVPQDAELSRHDPDVPEWSSLSDDQHRLYARMMEVFAGFLSHTDHQIGRVLDYLERTSELDNTIVMVISDNGASAEGGPTGTTNEAQFFNNAPEPFEDSLAVIDEIGGPDHFNHYPWGWTWAGNTPFRRWKRETYRGGSTDPFIVSWPRGISANGEVRHQYAHIIDIVPTVLDLIGITAPATIRGVTQSAIHGVSLADSLRNADAENRHRTQYFEMMGHRALYHDGWRAVCPWPGPSFAEAGKGFGEPIWSSTLSDLDAHAWELYHVDEDFAECHDVADENRDRLIALIATWYAEAGKYDVLPVDGSGLARFVGEKPLVAPPRDSYTFYPGTQSVPFFAGPRLLNRPHSISTAVTIGEASVEGVLLAQGTRAGGFSFFVKDRRLHYVHNWVGRHLFGVSSDVELEPGDHVLRFEFEPTGEPDLAHGHGMPGMFQLYVDGTLVGALDVPYTTPFAFNPGTLTCGADPGSTVTPEYAAPFRFTGTLEKVIVDLSGELIVDKDAELRIAMARQ